VARNVLVDQQVKENSSVLAVDASPEAVGLSQTRVRADNVQYEVADTFPGHDLDRLTW
jgi:hypothetical protein